MTERYYLGQGPLSGELLKRRFIFDANVWLHLYGPVQDHLSWAARTYSAFFADALKAGASFFLPQIIATEFVNRSLTLLADANGWQKKRDGKLHRHASYAVWAKDACDSLHAFEVDTIRLSDRFDEVDLDDLYKRIETGGALDFNDHIIAGLCRAHDMTLVTHDADFAGLDIPVVTANKRLG